MAKSWAIAFYASQAWRTVRREVLRRDHYTCSECYGRAAEVHHITELTPGNINDVRVALNPSNLISMCHDCHTKTTLGHCDTVAGYVFDDDGQVVQTFGRVEQ
jgi:5-methylcytosine-specific restriction endonuclease McrA